MGRRPPYLYLCLYISIYEIFIYVYVYLYLYNLYIFSVYLSLHLPLCVHLYTYVPTRYICACFHLSTNSTSISHLYPCPCLSPLVLYLLVSSLSPVPPFPSGWEPVNVREFERHAQLMLSKNAFDYYASGANDMVTLRENRYEINPLDYSIEGGEK